jgi:hypothetical protein
VAFAVVISLKENFASVIAGMSANTNPRKVGAAALPVVGPLNIVFAVWFARVAVIVPLAVTGEPLTEKIFGRAKATLVTVPIPAPVAAHVPSPRRNVEEVAEPDPNRAVAMTPDVTFDAAIFGTPLRLTTGVLVAVLIVIVNPLTELFALTLVTVPAPVGTAQVPSPRQKVPEDAFVPLLRLLGGRLPDTSDARLTLATVVSTPPVALTHPDEVNLPICLPVVLEKITAWPTVDVAVSLLTSPVPPPPPGKPIEQFHAKVEEPVWAR